MPLKVINKQFPGLSFITLLIFYHAICLKAETPVAGSESWIFRTRAVISGNSYESDPAGFKAYSGISLETGITRLFGKVWAAELNVRTESREIDRGVESGPAERLGSMEFLPIDLTLLYRPSISKRISPYLGFGANMTTVWEKSGVLDSLDVDFGVGPAVQFGFDYDLNRRALLNFDLCWHTLKTNISINGSHFAKLKIDPIAIGLGVGFRF